MKYVVTVYYSFDPETVVYLFDDYKAACEYLGKMWQYCYNSELAENEENVDIEESYHEEDYARIFWKDGGSRIWQVVGTSEPMIIV